MNVLAEMWSRLTGRGASAEAALAAEARSREEAEQLVAELAALRDEVKVLWDSRNQMMAQILRLKSEVSSCRDQIAASVNLFEQRTDQIYEGVMHRLAGHGREWPSGRAAGKAGRRRRCRVSAAGGLEAVDRRRPRRLSRPP